MPLCPNLPPEDGIPRLNRDRPRCCGEAEVTSAVAEDGGEADDSGAGLQARAHEALRNLGSGQDAAQLHPKVRLSGCSLVPPRCRRRAWGRPFLPLPVGVLFLGWAAGHAR